MGRLKIVALIAGGAALGAAGAGAAATLDGDDDRTIPAIVMPAGQPTSATPQQQQDQRVVVDDGIPTDAAETAAEAAVSHVGGRALSVDTDDGLYEVEVQRPDGAIVEVLLDGRTVLTIDRGDGDG
jgi:uncharacterized membrane protein YkoI